MSLIHAIVHALSITASMTWAITWALILGFGLSAMIQALVRKSTVIRLLGNDRPRTLALATGFGAASSSCSYAAVALARSLFRKGASFTAAMAFEIASTNLVIELGVILALLMGWQFTLAEFTGGPIMIVLIAVLFRLLLRERLLGEARAQADRGMAGPMEGHAAMDMSVQRPGSFASRLFSGEGYTAVAHVFVMEWAAIIRDLIIGLVAAGAIAAWVPDSFWEGLLHRGPSAGGQDLGTAHRAGRGHHLVRLLDRERAAGRRAVEGRHQLRRRDRLHLRRPDHRADPEHLPEVLRRPDGLFLLGTFYAAMAAAGYAIELVFGGLGLIPDPARAKLPDQGVSWDYTTWLNIVFLILAAALVIRFVRTGGVAMLRMMGGSPDSHDHMDAHVSHTH